jgi:hypothetical protein
MGWSAHLLRAVNSRSGVHSRNLGSHGDDVGSLTQAQLQAAAEFGTAAMQAFDEGGTFPAETVVGAIARMSGSFLLRSFGLPLTGIEPGAVVLSERANEDGPRLVEILGGVLQAVGVQLDATKVAAAQAAAKGQKDSFLQTQEALEPQFTAIRRKYGLNDGEAADTVAVATALLIKNCAQRLDPHVAFGLAVYGFIEGSKTAPAVTGTG